MTCQRCGVSIDYRFPTTCLNCNCELMIVSEAARPLTAACIPKDSLTFLQHLTNLTLIAGTTVGGMTVGAILTYFFGGCLYLIVFGNEVHDSYSCARGTAIGMLLIFAGAIVGSVCGGIFGFAHRTFKSAS